MRDRFLRSARVGALMLLAGAMALAAAESPAPDRAPRAPGPVDEVDRIEAPTAVPGTVVFAAPCGPTHQRALAAQPGVCRESILTEGETPGSLTDLERAKLSLARAAMEAARAAGTLWVTLPARQWDEAARARAQAAKIARLRSESGAELVPDRAAGVGEFPEVQMVGPPGPTEAELAKLRGEPAVVAAPPSAAPEATATERREEP